MNHRELLNDIYFLVNRDCLNPNKSASERKFKKEIIDLIDKHVKPMSDEEVHKLSLEILDEYEPALKELAKGIVTAHNVAQETRMAEEIKYAKKILKKGEDQDRTVISIELFRFFIQKHTTEIKL